MEKVELIKKIDSVIESIEKGKTKYFTGGVGIKYRPVPAYFSFQLHPTFKKIYVDICIDSRYT